MVRRRPLLRAVGGAACLAGNNTARQARERRHAEASPDQRTRDMGRRAAAGAFQPVPVQAMPSLCDGLAQLNCLHDRGALSDGEFAAARVRLLGG